MLCSACFSLAPDGGLKFCLAVAWLSSNVDHGNKGAFLWGLGSWTHRVGRFHLGQIVGIGICIIGCMVRADEIGSKADVRGDGLFLLRMRYG